MVLAIQDWVFDIDLEKTRDHADYMLLEHCTCPYCENYYRTANRCYPELKLFLKQFGLEIDGPVELYPFEPTLYLSGYRVTGRVLQAGNAPIMVNQIPISAVPGDNGLFLLEVGEMPLPWVLPDDPEEVLSPANEPEFLWKMYRKMAQRFGTGLPIQS